MAEQLICNQQVDGSTPFTSSNSCNVSYGSVPERPKGADCKSVVNDFAGPNPATPITKKTCLCKSFLLSWSWHRIRPDFDSVKNSVSSFALRRCLLASISRGQKFAFGENPAWCIGKPTHSEI